MTEQIVPLETRIVIENVCGPEKSKGGILLPEGSDMRMKPQRGRVVAVGEGKLLDDGTYRKPTAQVGDEIVYVQYAGLEIELNEKKIRILEEEDILAKIVSK